MFYQDLRRNFCVKINTHCIAGLSFCPWNCGIEFVQINLRWRKIGVSDSTNREYSLMMNMYADMVNIHHRVSNELLL